MKKRYFFGMILFISVLIISGCSDSVDEPVSTTTTSLFEPEEKIDIPSPSESLEISCTEMGGECVDPEGIKIEDSGDLFKGKVIGLYKCEEIMCVLPSEIPYDVKEAYEMVYYFMYYGIISSQDDEIWDFSYDDMGDDFVLTTSSGKSFTINKDSGILYCMADGEQGSCHEAYLAAFDGAIIMESQEDGYSCLGNCGQGVKQEYDRRKAFLPEP